MTRVASAAPGLTRREGEGAGPFRALLLHTAPGEVMDVLRACPGLEWAAATSAGEVQARLVDHDPEVVLSIKTSEFPGPAHAAALQWGDPSHISLTRQLNAGVTACQRRSPWTRLPTTVRQRYA